MAGINRMLRGEVRKLARQGKLVDEAFKVFQRMVYPGAPPDQVAALRITFFAGAAEVAALLDAGLDDGLTETDGDMAFMSSWMDEIARFHARTLAAMTAGGKPDA